MKARFAIAVGAALLAAAPARAAGPVETGVYSVTGVEVDVTDKDAASAKTKAIIEAQVKAFGLLAERLGSPDAAAALKETPPDQIGRMLKSLSIEEERSGPGRYVGKLTIRFMPAKIKAAFGKHGIVPVESQAPPVVVVPVWNTAEGPQLWEDNPWRAAWINLHAEQAIVPVIVPLGDLEDTQAITALQALNREPVMLDAIMKRYGAKSILVAVAAPQEDNGVHAVMIGDSPLGKITFDKRYTAEDATVAASAALAAGRFHGVMLEKWRSIKQRAMADARARDDERKLQEAAQSRAVQIASLSVAVPFNGAGEWNAIRRRISATPGVEGVDISTIGGNGAVVRLAYSTSFQTLRSALQGSGLRLDQIGGSWVIQPL